MKTLGQVLKLSCEYIQSKNISQGRLEVELLIAHLLGLKRLDLYLKFDQPLDDHELEAIRKGLSRLARGEPLAYIEGEVFFYNCRIRVDKRVLIPRPETELMVEHIIKSLPADSKTILDVCTGSGCIGIAIKKALPNLTVVLSDISEDALCLAKENAKINGVDVTTVQGDLLEPFTDKQIDFIVCNPPYIRENDFHGLDEHVKDFEPKGALVSGLSGFECYEKLAKTVPTHAVCWLEVGAGQAEHVATLFQDAGFTSIKTFYDFSKHARFLEIR
jgi:release factor glutamine methyltransferase